MDLVIFHKSCPDGWCSAFIASKKYPEAELLGLDHGLEPPYDKVAGKDVLVVDFSWRTREQNNRMAELAKSFQILDHHLTAQAVLADADYAVFDMNRSGAGLTWDYLFGINSPLLKDDPLPYRVEYAHDLSVWQVARPWYVSYVEDRDLWRHKLPNSKEVNAFIMALSHTADAWSALDVINEADAIELGRGAVAQINHYVEKMIEHRQIGRLNNFSVAVVNAPYMNISEVGHELTKYADIGMGYFERGDGIIQFSLRSIGDIDVSVIAKSFNGGGHKNAAGFQLKLEYGRQLVDRILGRLKD